MPNRFTRRSTLEELTIDQLLCHIYNHAWRDTDAVPMIWGSSRVEHWKLLCMRCKGGATEYRDPVTCERIGQRQYQQAPGYLTGIAYGRSDYLIELRKRRRAERDAADSKVALRRKS